MARNVEIKARIASAEALWPGARARIGDLPLLQGEFSARATFLR